MRVLSGRVLAVGLMLGLSACGEGGDRADAAPAKAAATAQTARSTPARDWNAVVTATPEGGFRIGNPDAPVKFLEFASLTCPHCRDFHKAALGPLRRDYIATGRVSYELRNFVLNGPDLAVTMLARCQGAGPYFKLVDAFYDQQPVWIVPFTKITDDDQKRMGALPRERQTLALADLGNVDDFMRLRGMPRARYEACLTDTGAVAQLERIRAEAIDKFDLQGTPTFVINGETQPQARDWPAIEALIRDRLG